METKSIQQQLFRFLKEQLPAHLSLPDELGTLLQLSPDSVYRRIRGEKPLTLDELSLICKHYHLSLDQLLQLKNDAVLFRAPGLESEAVSFAAHMKGMADQFHYFNSFKKKEIYYLCKDAPIWYFYLFPAMAAFKTFFWSKTINNEEALQHKQFSLKEFPYTDCFELGQELIREHNKMDTVELWNLESIHSSINQIAYYREAGIFKSGEDLIAVADDFLRMLDHLQAQAAAGRKFMPGQTTAAHKGTIRFYVNELILGNNTAILTLDQQQLAMVTYSVFNYLITSDSRFVHKAFTTFNTLLSRSTLVSESGEKERNRFFNIVREKVQALKE